MAVPRAERRHISRTGFGPIRGGVWRHVHHWSEVVVVRVRLSVLSSGCIRVRGRTLGMWKLDGAGDALVLMFINEMCGRNGL